jgi:hypothetical protein
MVELMKERRRESARAAAAADGDGARSGGGAIKKAYHADSFSSSAPTIPSTT